MTQGTQTGLYNNLNGVGKDGKWEEDSRGRGHMYIYGSFMFM